jgi:hypothetical protein
MVRLSSQMNPAHASAGGYNILQVTLKKEAEYFSKRW